MRPTLGLIAAAAAALCIGVPLAGAAQGLGKAVKSVQVLAACTEVVRADIAPSPKSLNVRSIHGDEIAKTGVWKVEFDATVGDRTGRSTRYVGHCMVGRDGRAVASYRSTPAI